MRLGCVSQYRKWERADWKSQKFSSPLLLTAALPTIFFKVHFSKCIFQKFFFSKCIFHRCYFQSCIVKSVLFGVEKCKLEISEVFISWRERPRTVGWGKRTQPVHLFIRPNFEKRFTKYIFEWNKKTFQFWNISVQITNISKRTQPVHLFILPNFQKRFTNHWKCEKSTHPINVCICGWMWYHVFLNFMSFNIRLFSFQSCIYLARSPFWEKWKCVPIIRCRCIRSVQVWKLSWQSFYALTLLSAQALHLRPRSRSLRWASHHFFKTPT